MRALFTAYVLLLSFNASAEFETTNILPNGVRNLRIRYGSVSGLNEAFTENGELRYLSDINSVELDSQFISKFDSRIENLIALLNQFGTYQIGDQLNLGRLSIVANPSVNFTAPMFAFGLNKKTTIGIAVPVVRFENSIGVSQVESNLPDIQAELGPLNVDLNQAFNDLNSGLTSGFRDSLASKGYKPLTSRSETFLGDIVLFSIHQFEISPDTTQALQFQYGLPTGPKADPSDLTDLENFNRISFRPMWLLSHKLSKSWSTIFLTTYQYFFEQEVDKRVPTDMNDSLPGPETQRSVRQKIGDVWSVMTGINFKLDDSLSFGLAFQYEEKAKDDYGGIANVSNSILRARTDREAQVVRFEAEYSTVNQYLRNKFAIPLALNYEVSQVFQGRNIENQTRHEVNFSVFF
jgi:hypothetical protein